MRKFFVAGASALALAVTASPAYAVTDLGSMDLTASDIDPDPNFFYSFFNFSALGGTLAPDITGYKKTFTFDFPMPGTGTGSATASLVGAANTIFNMVLLNGTPFDLTNGNTQADLNSPALIVGPPPAQNQLEVFFDIVDNSQLAGFTGDVSATAVPEPMTWALMLLGFAGIGLSMRRRKPASTRVRYAF